jgi:uncharacterized membrane protein YgcG
VGSPHSGLQRESFLLEHTLSLSGHPYGALIPLLSCWSVQTHKALVTSRSRYWWERWIPHSLVGCACADGAGGSEAGAEGRLTPGESSNSSQGGGPPAGGGGDEEEEEEEEEGATVKPPEGQT